MEEKYTSSELQRWLIDKAVEVSSPQTLKNRQNQLAIPKFYMKRTMTSNRARNLVLANEQRGRDTPFIGRLYFYKYNPLWREKLSYYDKFPMCVPIARYSDGFLGLNLHYLPMSQRELLLIGLSRYNNQALINKNTRFVVSYDTIRSDPRIYQLAEPCIHRYLFTQVRSKFIQIFPDEFDKAIQLPVEDWVFNQ